MKEWSEWTRAMGLVGQGAAEAISFLGSVLWDEGEEVQYPSLLPSDKEFFIIEEREGDYDVLCNSTAAGLLVDLISRKSLPRHLMNNKGARVVYSTEVQWHSVKVTRTLEKLSAILNYVESVK